MWRIVGIGEKSVTFKDMNGTDAIISFQEKEGVELTYLGNSLFGKTRMTILESKGDSLQIQRMSSKIVKTPNGKLLRLNFVFKGILCLVDFPLLKI
jgi:hypothetical protein